MLAGQGPNLAVAPGHIYQNLLRTLTTRTYVPSGRLVGGSVLNLFEERAGQGMWWRERDRGDRGGRRGRKGRGRGRRGRGVGVGVGGRERGSWRKGGEENTGGSQTSISRRGRASNECQEARVAMREWDLMG